MAISFRGVTSNGNQASLQIVMKTRESVGPILRHGICCRPTNGDIAGAAAVAAFSDVAAFLAGASGGR